MKNAKEWFSSHNNEQALSASIAAHKELMETYGYKDPVPYFARAEPMIKQTFEDAPQLNSARVGDKRANTVSALLWLSDNIADVISGELEPDVHPLSTLSYTPGEILPDLVQTTYVAGFDHPVDMWSRQIGPSASGDALSIDIFRSLKVLLSRSSMPSNLSENMADALAKTIINQKFTTAEQINLLFLSRGAGDQATLAQVTAAKIASSVEQMRFVADISNFSIVGEGFTNKSRERITTCVTVDHPFAGAGYESDIVYSIGFQMVRNAPLYRLVDGTLIYNDRRHIHVHVPGSLVQRYAIEQWSFSPVTAFYNARDPTLNSEL
jgi:hypothetical protein